MRRFLVGAISMAFAWGWSGAGLAAQAAVAEPSCAAWVTTNTNWLGTQYTGHASCPNGQRVRVKLRCYSSGTLISTVYGSWTTGVSTAVCTRGLTGVATFEV